MHLRSIYLRLSKFIRLNILGIHVKKADFHDPDFIFETILDVIFQDLFYLKASYLHTIKLLEYKRVAGTHAILM